MALGTGAAVGAVAAFCRAPSVVFADAGELLTAVALGGVAHPPGFPLYLVLGRLWLAVLRPLGMHAASALNLFSSACNGLSTALVVTAAFVLLDRVKAPVGEAGKGVLAVLVGLLAGFGPTLFDFSLSIEVYALHSVFLSGAIAASIGAGGEKSPHRRRVLTTLAGLFAGGGLAVHHATMVVIVPGLLCLLYAAEEARERTARAGLFVAAVLPGILSYAVLPVRAAGRPALNWGNPSNLFRFWVHVSARDYQVNIESSVEKTLAHAARFLQAYRAEFSVLGLGVALLGLLFLVRRERLLFAGFLAMLLGDVAFAVRYEIAEDQAAYYIPVFLATALLFGVGAAVVQEKLDARRKGTGRLALAVAAALVLAVTAGNVSARGGRRLDRRAPESTASFLASSPPGALVFTTEWNLYSPVLAAREVEGKRGDLLVLDVLLLRRGWYLDSLERGHPDRLSGAAEEFGRYRSKLSDWEEGRPYSGDELTRLYCDFTKKMVRVAWSQGIDVVWVGTVLGQHLPQGAALVPSGIGYRVLPSQEMTAVFVPDSPVSVAAALRPGLPLDEVFEQKIRPIVAGMRVQRAMYDDAFG